MIKIFSNKDTAYIFSGGILKKVHISGKKIMQKFTNTEIQSDVVYTIAESSRSYQRHELYYSKGGALRQINMLTEFKRRGINPNTVEYNNVYFGYLNLSCWEPLPNVTFNNCTFECAGLQGIKFWNAKFNNCSFQECSFRSTDLRYCSFANCSFTSSRFSKSNFSHSTFFITSFANCKFGRLGTENLQVGWSSFNGCTGITNDDITHANTGWCYGTDGDGLYFIKD